MVIILLILKVSKQIVTSVVFGVKSAPAENVKESDLNNFKLLFGLGLIASHAIKNQSSPCVRYYLIFDDLMIWFDEIFDSNIFSSNFCPESQRVFPKK